MSRLEQELKSSQNISFTVGDMRAKNSGRRWEDRQQNFELLGKKKMALYSCDLFGQFLTPLKGNLDILAMDFNTHHTTISECQQNVVSMIKYIKELRLLYAGINESDDRRSGNIDRRNCLDETAKNQEYTGINKLYREFTQEMMPYFINLTYYAKELPQSDECTKEFKKALARVGLFLKDPFADKSYNVKINSPLLN